MPDREHPELPGVILPRVTIDGDLNAAVKAVKNAGTDIESLIELAIYLTRESKKVEVLNELDKTVRSKIDEHYERLKPSERATVRTTAGMVTYSAPGKKREIKDRDSLVEILTADQLRATYVPDLKALETVLKKAVFETVTKETSTPARIAVKDLGGEFETF